MTDRVDRMIGGSCAAVIGAAARPAVAGLPAVVSWGGALFLYLAMVLGASPVVAQTAASGSVVVRVPPVAHMEVEAVAASPSEGVFESVADGAFQIRVRANHGWQVVLAATAGSAGEGEESTGAGELWVRTDGADGSSELRRIEPGQSLAVASGARGEAVIRLEYWWEGGSPEASAAVPFTYTLASR